jgi:hypothetical protein
MAKNRTTMVAVRIRRISTYPHRWSASSHGRDSKSKAKPACIFQSRQSMMGGHAHIQSATHQILLPKTSHPRRRPIPGQSLQALLLFCLGRIGRHVGHAHGPSGWRPHRHRCHDHLLGLLLLLLLLLLEWWCSSGLR